MFFRSFLRSSWLEVVASKRIVSLLYAIFGLSIFAEWGGSTWQFVSAYRAGEGFDVTQIEFIYITLLLFLPFTLVGALLLRALFVRIRLYYWFKSRMQVPLYASRLRPAEAGYLVDYAFGLPEVHATLLDLHFRDAIRLESAAGGIVLMPGDLSQAAPYEQVLVNTLLNGAPEIRLLGLQDPRLIAAAKYAEQSAEQRLQSSGALPESGNPSMALRIFARILFCVAGFVGVVSTYALIFDTAEVLAIGYPRSPMTLVEVFIMTLVMAILGAVLVSGYWPRFGDDPKSAMEQAWMHAAGFKQYVQVVFAPRLGIVGALQTQTPDTVRTYLPYLVAYGLTPLTIPLLEAALAKTPPHNQ